MKFKLLLVIISFVLEIVTSVFFNANGYFIPLFAFLTTIHISFYIRKKKQRLLFCFFIGLLYDIVITNTLFLNSIIFFGISWIISYLENRIYENELTFLLSFFCYILLYRILTYLILNIIGYTSFSFDLLIKSILVSISLNFIYLILLKKILKPYSEL